MRLGDFVLGLAQTANYGLQERISVASRLSDDDFFQVVKEAISLLPHARIRRAQVLCQRLHNHDQVCVDQGAHFLRAKYHLEALLCLCLHLSVVVIEQLAVGINQVDKAGMRVAYRCTLSSSKLLQLVDSFQSLLPIIRICAVNQVSHFFDQVAINWF